MIVMRIAMRRRGRLRRWRRKIERIVRPTPNVLPLRGQGADEAQGAACRKTERKVHRSRHYHCERFQRGREAPRRNGCCAASRTSARSSVESR